MDVVITYVNGQDPLWQQDYAKAAKWQEMAKRFRDWGTLPYLLRGVEKNLPDVGKVHLVVARDSQVPAWLNRDEVNVVLHSDIIPADKLPVFNSASIEMFLHRIPGLAEEFVYMNDDFFPVAPMSKEELFVDGKAACHFAKHLFTFGHLYRQHVKKSCDRARLAAGKAKSPVYLRPQHTIAPNLKSSCEELYSIAEQDILDSVSTLKEAKNYNQYLFVDYMYFKGRSVDKRISNKHISMASTSPEGIRKFLAKPTSKVVCINDVQMSDEKINAISQALHESFQQMFPQKSRFEK